MSSRPNSLLDPQHGVLDLVGQADVGRYGNGVAADLADDIGSVLDRRGPPAKHGDARSATRHFDGRGATHPGSAAGDEGDLVLEEVRREAHFRKLLHGCPDC